MSTEFSRLMYIVGAGSICVLCAGCATRNQSEASDDDSAHAVVERGEDVYGSLEEDTGNSPLRVVLASQGDAPPTDFVAVVSFPGGGAVRFSCPQPPWGSRFSCTDTGIRVEKPTDRLQVTIKAHGHGFVTQALSIHDLTASNGESVATIDIPRLQAFEHKDDYDTGYAAGKEGLQTFISDADQMDTELGASYAVKFYIELNGTNPKVYFQNTRKHPLHHEFARSVLGLALSVEDFEARTYHSEQRTAMAGTLVYYPQAVATSEAFGQTLTGLISLNFFPSDDLTPKQAMLAYRLLEERIGFASLAKSDPRLVYLPAGEVQEAQWTQHTGEVAAGDSMWITRQALYGNQTMQILNPGVAFGTLRRLSPEELANTPVSFRDILLLPRLPNELPIVGGTITEERQTPLAHVNVAARNRGTPNLSLINATNDSRVAGLIGKLVRFEIKGGTFTLASATIEQAETYWKSRQRNPYSPERDDAAEGLKGFEELVFADSLSVGVKAANLAELSRLLGPQAPHGFAVPFHDYIAFLRESRLSADSCTKAKNACTAGARSAAACEKAYVLCSQSGGCISTVDTPMLHREA